MLCDRSSAGYNKDACVKPEFQSQGIPFVHPALHNFASICEQDFPRNYAQCVASAKGVVDITECDKFLAEKGQGNFLKV
jgi:hypothetical protein